mgnify:CR=1 FL=1
MPNYREQTGEVGTYNNLKVNVLHGGEFVKKLINKQVAYDTIYCLKDIDPYHKLLPDCMYAYMINKDDPNNVYCLGTMGNYGKVNFKKNISSCEKFALANKPAPTPDISRNPDATAAIDDILSEIRSWNTKINYADYTKTVDAYLEALA